MEENIKKIEPMDNPDYIGKVIMIPNQYTVIINAGLDIVNIDDTVIVCEPGADITDPETQATLGTFDFVKSRLKVVETYESYSVCKSIQKRSGNKIQLSISPLFDTLTEEYTEKLPVNEGDNQNLSIKNNLISIGDYVKIAK